MKKYYLLLIAFLFISSALYAQRFVLADSLPRGAYGTAAWGDYDGDGRKDLVYITQTQVPGDPDIFHVYHNTPGGLVKVPQVFNSITNPAAAWGDLDDDGKEDLVVSGMGNVGHLFIYKSNGDGTFIEQTGSWPGFSFGSVAIADYNNDGLKDIAAMGILSSGLFETATLVLKNGGGFNFTDINAGLTGAYRGEIKWFDYDMDGKTDLAYNGSNEDGTTVRLHIYHNEGNDVFLPLGGYRKGALEGTIDWLDYDGDGRKDLIATGVDSIGAFSFADVYKNNSTGILTLGGTNLLAFGEPSAADVADFDGDGRADICLGGGSDLLSTAPAVVFYNTGTPNFIIEPIPFNQMDLLQNCIVAAADIDNDGDQDLLCANYILMNNGSALKVTEQELKQVSVYPNPAGTYFNISNPLGELQINLVDISGRTVINRKLKKGVYRIDIRNYAAGVYQLILSAGNNARLIKQVVIYK